VRDHNNGKLFLSYRNARISQTTENTSYPIGSLTTRLLSISNIFANDNNVRLLQTGALNAEAGTGYPTLKPIALITGFLPFVNNSDGSPLYRGTVTRSGTPYANNLLALRKQNANNGKTNLVFFAIDFHLLSGDLAAQQTVFDRILNQEFNW
jgi:hypothetical protein